MEKKGATQTAYAKRKGCDQSLISKYIKSGKISKKALIRQGRRFLIDVDQADEDLRRNLDPIFVKPKGRFSDQTKIVLQDFYPEFGWDIQNIDATVEKVMSALIILSFLSDHACDEWSAVIDDCILQIVQLLKGEKE